MVSAKLVVESPKACAILSFTVTRVLFFPLSPLVAVAAPLSGFLAGALLAEAVVSEHFGRFVMEGEEVKKANLS